MHYPAVEFSHFYGISHRRYRELFERTRRKDQNGKFLEWDNALEGEINPLSGERKEVRPRPIIDLKFPFYVELEKPILEAYTESLKIIDSETNDQNSTSNGPTSAVPEWLVQDRQH